MCFTSEDVEIYSRNKNILFEPINDVRGLVNLVNQIGHRVLRAISCPAKAVFSERIVEYPLLFQYVKSNWKSILDFGCAEDLFPIHLASLGYKVTGLDFRLYPFSHPNFTHIQADIITWKPPKGEFDCVISVSTIEHVGLGGFGDPVVVDGDKIAVQKLFDAAKTGGNILITVPFGKPTTKRYTRIYNHSRLHELVPNICIERFFAKRGRYDMWQEVSWHDAEKIEYEDYFAISPCEAVACVVAKKD